MPLFKPINPNFKNEISASFANLVLMHTIGAQLARIEPGEVDVDLPFRNDLTQQHGFMAAAVVSAILDVACGYAAMSLMPPGATVLTVEFKVNLLAPAIGERFIARARVTRSGRNLSVCAGDVFALIGKKEKPVATMLATMMTIKDAANEPHSRKYRRRKRTLQRVQQSHSDVTFWHLAE